MGDNGAGTFTPPAASFPEVPDTLIDATRFDATILDMATAISNRICKDGQTTVTANIPFNNFKATGMAQGTARTDSATLANIQDGTGVYTASVGGTPNVITLTLSPAIATYTAGQMFRFLAASTNTAAVTVAVSGLAAKAITKNGTTPLIAGDIPAGGIVDITYDGTQFLIHATGRDYATLTGAETLTNKTLTSPLINAGTVGANPTTALGIANKQYVDALSTYAAYTSTDTIATTTRTADLSGASFTLTLNTAVGVAGKRITVLHNGTSLTQVYTLAAAASETIDATSTYLLYTAGERLTIESNGTNWIVIDHQASTDWTDAGVMTITGTTSNPTKPTTPDIDKHYWRREGNRVFLRYILRISSATGGTTGTGTYLFALPSNITFDTTILTPVATAITTAVRSEGSASFLDGHGLVTNDSTSINRVSFFAYDTSHFQALSMGIADASTVSVGTIGDTIGALNDAEKAYNFELNARAANWRL